MEDIDKEIEELEKEWNDILNQDQPLWIKNMKCEHVGNKISMLKELKEKILEIRRKNEKAKEIIAARVNHEIAMMRINNGWWIEEPRLTFMQKIKKYFTLY